MKLFYKMLVFFALLPVVATAQSFSFNADTTEFSQPPGSLFDIFAEIENTSSLSLNLTIVRTQNDLPSTGWSSSLCIGELCFDGAIDTIDARLFFGPLRPDSLLDFHLQANSDPNIPGTATVTVKVENQVDLADTLAITFTFTTGATAIGEPGPVQAEGFRLDQNYLNPFNPGTVIPYELRKAGRVSLEIYDASGRRVRSLVSATLQGAGSHRAVWDGRNDAGAPVSSGTYFYRLRTVEGMATQKMSLIR